MEQNQSQRHKICKNIKCQNTFFDYTPNMVMSFCQPKCRNSHYSQIRSQMRAHYIPIGEEVLCYTDDCENIFIKKENTQKYCPECQEMKKRKINCIFCGRKSHKKICYDCLKIQLKINIKLEAGTFISIPYDVDEIWPTDSYINNVSTYSPEYNPFWSNDIILLKNRDTDKIL